MSIDNLVLFIFSFVTCANLTRWLIVLQYILILFISWWDRSHQLKTLELTMKTFSAPYLSLILILKLRKFPANETTNFSYTNLSDEWEIVLLWSAQRHIGHASCLLPLLLPHIELTSGVTWIPIAVLIWHGSWKIYIKFQIKT